MTTHTHHTDSRARCDPSRAAWLSEVCSGDGGGGGVAELTEPSERGGDSVTTAHWWRVGVLWLATEELFGLMFDPQARGLCVLLQNRTIKNIYIFDVSFRLTFYSLLSERASVQRGLLLRLLSVVPSARQGAVFGRHRGWGERATSVPAR